MRRLDHPYIAKTYESWSSPDLNTLYISMEFAPGNMRRMMNNCYGKMPKEYAKLFMYQTLKALDYLHKSGVIHRDIKADNILITDQNVAKVIDFGLSGIDGDWKFTDPILLFYPIARTQRAPEIYFSSLCLSPKIDIYAAGWLLCELLVGYECTEAGPISDVGSLNYVVHLLGATPENIEAMRAHTVDYEYSPWPFVPKLENLIKDNEITDLMRGMLQIDYHKRMTAEEALAHPWFDDLRAIDTDPNIPPTDLKLKRFNDEGHSEIKAMIRREMALQDGCQDPS